MAAVRWIRKAHRYLGLLVGLQLLAWTASGLYFAWNPIERVRGEDLAAEPERWRSVPDGLLGPAAVLAAFYAAHPDTPEVMQLTLRPLLGEPVYEVAYRASDRVRYALLDARSGQLRSPIQRQEAIRIAERDFLPEAPVRQVRWIEQVEPGGEYRDKELPAWCVEFDHPTETRIYVAAERGLVTARRNATWRVFDFLWMLHIMDYRDRTDFNHLLLRVLSVLGLLTVFSGLLLWAVTSPWLRRRSGRRQAAMRSSIQG